LGLLSGASILLAIITRGADDPSRAGAELLAEYGLGVVAPVCTLWLGASAIGDLVEDRTLVYLWLRPIPRWQLGAAAVASTLVIVAPLVGVPLVVAAALTETDGAIAGSAAAVALGAIAYSGVFVALGARVNRALWWGLGYVLVWENSIARISDGTARLAVRSYTHTILSKLTDEHLRLADRSTVASVVVPLALAVLAVLWTARVLTRREID
ncbi:MAG: hypothetical protein KDB21_10290, partial [Acidimicrobiales bacterium]|nr:hypothetical protein [Acidimicrobiales bacterium]